MLTDRNDTVHIYDGEAADRLVYKILDSYIGCFKEMEVFLDERYGKNNLRLMIDAVTEFVDMVEKYCMERLA